MRWSDIPLNPDRRTLRQFAGIWLVFFGALAAWKGLWQGHMLLAGVLAALALAVGVLGLIAPTKIRLIFVGASIAAFPIGWVVSHTILALFFYLVLSPIGMIFRLLGRDALLLRKAPAAMSYWTVKRAAASDRDYFNQF